MAATGGDNYRITFNAGMDVSGILGAVKQMQGAFNGLKLPASLTADMLKDFDKLRESLTKFKSITEKSSLGKADLKNLDKLQKEIDSAASHLFDSFKDISNQKFYLDADLSKIREAEAEVEKLKSTLQNKLSGIKIDLSTSSGSSVSLGLTKMISDMERGVKSSKVLSSAMSQVWQSVQAGNFSEAGKQLAEIESKAGSLKGASAGLLDVFKQWGIINFDGPAKNIDNMEQRVQLLGKAFQALLPQFSQDSTEVQKLAKEIDNAVKSKEELEKTGQQNWTNSLKPAIEQSKELADTTHQVTQAEKEMAQAGSEAAEQIKQLQQSTQYFFGLRNMLNLFKRGIREAVETVKELDAAMTETAVVTDFSVGDMWKDLPKYTQLANELGATTQGAYETMTLYYQQGLNQEQAFALGAETMKMARIAGLDYAETTDMMTAALRGFNMELDETSAKRVNDVYSKLAAVTASDTEELGTAMQRTASIAHSAGMSFEGTTAFLAQAIETTREPAENIGTAMKTIIARMQEMKKNPLEISEVDGEEVDYNKIDGALRSIGVSLKETNGDFKDNDKVLLEIAQRWDSLTQTQQRYIATSVAGSRQQSRFIAMVSNYERTMELMDAANNSSGASDEQFGKTAESLEYKLNKLQNAWKEFLMNIMNDSWTKSIVDTGTKVLDVINNIINTLSLNGKLKGVKSGLSLLTAFTGLKMAGRGANALIGGLGGILDPKSSFKEGLRGGAIGSQAAKISNPIVKAIYSLIPHIDRRVAGEDYRYQQFGNYKNAREELRSKLSSDKTKLGVEQNANAGKYSFSDIRSVIDRNKLNKEQQAALFKTMPGLKHNMTKALSKMLQDYGTDPETARSLAQGFKKGEIPFDKALEKSGLLVSYADKMAQITEKEGQKKAAEFQREQRKTLSREQRQQILDQGKNTEGLRGQALRKYYVQESNKLLSSNMYAANGKAAALMDQQFELTGAEKAADSFGKVGGALTNAGISLQMWAASISEVNPLLGEMASKAGGLLTSLGALPNMISSIIAGGPVVWGITAAVTALGVAFGIAEHKANGIRKTAEEVTKTFKDTNQETQKDIDTLKQYQSQAKAWSEGVDANGYNVSLSDDDYKQYLDAVQRIAEINPSIVKGYNAQGQAIIDINTALKETIRLRKQDQEEALKNYLDPSSLDKIVKARNIDDNFQKIANVYKGGTLSDNLLSGMMGPLYNAVDPFLDLGWKESAGKWIDSKLDTNLFTKTSAPFASDATDILKNLKKDLSDADLAKALEPFEIDLDKLAAGDAYSIQQLVKNRDQIYSAALNASKDGLSQKTTEAFSTLDESVKAADEAIQPTLDWLKTSISQSPALKALPDELESSVMAGLKDIALRPDLQPDEMRDQAQALVKEFDNLTAEGSKYSLAMEKVEEAQNNFAESLDADEYAEGTKSALAELDSLMQTYAGRTDAYSQAIAEYLQNQMERIRNFTEEGSISLTEGLNGVTDTISAAEGAYKSFQEATKSDLSTGKDSMKSIFDEVTKETDGVALHMASKGDATMWQGARALLGDEFVDKYGDNVDKIKKEIRSLEPELQAGEAGFAAFWENFQKVDDSKIKGFTWNDDGSYDADRNINPDVYKQIAEQMHRSEEYVVAMLNAGRQFADIDFHNVDDVRKALSTDEAAIKNNGKIFVKSDYYENALDEAKIFGEERTNIKKQDEAAGIIQIKDPDKITKKDLAQMGIDSMPDLIKTFGDTNQFTRDEIADYAKKLGDYNPDDFDSAYQHYLDTQEHPELQPIESIQSTVERIADLIAQEHVEEGKITEKDETTAKDFYDSIIGEEGKNDTATQYFGEGKNEYGNVLSPEQYKQTKANLEKAAEFAKEQKELYERGAETAHANKDYNTEKRLRAVADEYATSEQSINANLKEGEKNWATAYANQKYNEALQSGIQGRGAEEYAQQAYDKAYEEATNIVNEISDGSTKGIEDSGTKAEKETNQKVYDWYNNYGLGNTDLTNRPTIEWGKEPSEQGKNWDAASTYGWTEDQLRNSTSTYMSAWDTFNNGKGNEVAVTFTPVTQDGQVLDQNTMSEYIQNLVESAKTNTDGSINIEDLMHLDEQGAPVEGQKISNMLLGAFEGLGAEESADLLGQLEHYASEANVQSIEGLSSVLDTKIAEGDKAAERLKQVIDSGEKVQQDNSKTDSTTSGSEVADAATMNASGPATKFVDFITNFKTEGKEETEQAEDNVKEKADKGAEHVTKFKATGDTDVEKKLSGVSSQAAKKDTKTVEVKGGTTPVQKPLEMQDKFSPKLKSIESSAKKPISKTLNILPHFVGSWHQNVYLSATGPGAKAEKGMNNKISYHHVPMAGSLAKGTKKGRIGPRGQGGLTLTGERGYEIGWLPDENRSMILGANGPQMVNLPRNAVVYNHEQSKEIMKKRKGISAGSMDHGSYIPSTPSSTNYAKTVVKNAKNAGDKVSKTAEDTAKAVARVLVWWDNAARRADAIQRKADKNQTSYEKYLKEIRATLKDTGTTGQGNDFIANTQKAITEYQRQYNRATKELNTMDTGKAAKTKKGRKKQYAKGADNIVEVSYKKGKKQKTAYMNTAKYIKYDAASGSYQIDQKQLNKIKNKDQRKAFYEAAKKELEDRISKKNAAEDNIQKAQEALEKFSEELYETFFSWENELTQIWNITQQIEQAQARISGRDAFSDLLEKQLSTGLIEGDNISKKSTLDNFQEKLKLQNQVLQDRQEAIKLSQQEISKIVNSDEEKQILAEVEKKLKEGGLDETQKLGYEQYKKELEDQIETQNLARQFTSITRRADGTVDIVFDTEEFEQERLNGNLTSEMGKAIQDWVKSLQEASGNLQENIENLTTSITEYYSQLEDLQNNWADYGKELTEISEAAEKEKIDKLKKLYDGIKKALDDLLNDVKRKLDERRKQEDNAKTERSISQKQQRLATLRADTSGGHQVEIAQLEQEIADAQNDYQRSLEDQLLDKLQQQADEASKQRERQIELQEALAETTNNIAQVNEWMARASGDLTDEELAKLKEEIRGGYYSNKNYDNVTTAEQERIADDFEQFFNGLITNQKKQQETIDAINDAKDIIKRIETYLALQSTTLDTLKTSDVTKGLGVRQVQETSGFSLAELKQAGYTAQEFANDNYTSSDVRNAGFSAQEASNAGYTLTDLVKGGYTAKELKDAGFTDIKALKEAGATNIKDAFTAAEYQAADYTYAQAKEEGYTLPELKNAGGEYATLATAEDKKNKNDAYMNKLKEIKKIKPANVKSSHINTLFDLGAKAGYGKASVLQHLVGKTGGSDPFTWKNIFKAIIDANGIDRYNLVKTWPKGNGSLADAIKTLKSNPDSYSEIKKHRKYKSATALKFATGGLADFTGPAWLDGTPSKPELVLNAKDTQNFIALRDVLSKAMSSTGAVENTYGGDAMYEININVDKIEKDYDVDRVIEKVKKEITKGAGYRNVTQVRNFR